MIKHYLQIIFRNSIRQKKFSLLNIIGLSIGMTCFIIIMLWIQIQFSYDRHNEHYENIYLTGIDVKMGEMEGKGTSSASPMGLALKEDYPREYKELIRAYFDALVNDQEESKPGN